MVYSDCRLVCCGYSYDVHSASYGGNLKRHRVYSHESKSCDGINIKRHNIHRQNLSFFFHLRNIITCDVSLCITYLHALFIAWRDRFTKCNFMDFKTIKSVLICYGSAKNKTNRQR